MTISYVGTSAFYVAQEEGNKLEVLPSGIQDGDFLLATVRNQGADYYCLPTSAGANRKWRALPVVFNQLNPNLIARASLYRNSGNCTIYAREFKLADTVESWQFGGLSQSAKVEIHAFRGSGGKLYLDDFACNGDSGATFRIFSEYTGAAVVITVSNISSSGETAPSLSGMTTLRNTSSSQLYLKDTISGDLNISLGSGNKRLVACLKLIETQKNVQHVDTFHIGSTTGSSIVVPEPEGLKVGDLMVVSATGTHYSSGPTGVTPPANQGWVELAYLNTEDTYDPNHVSRHALYVRKVTSLLGNSYWSTDSDNFKVVVSGFRSKGGEFSYSYTGVKQQTSSESINVSLATSTPSGKALVGIVTPSGSGNSIYELKGNSVAFNFNDSDAYKTVNSVYAINSSMSGSGMIAWAVVLTSETAAKISNQFFKHNF